MFFTGGGRALTGYLRRASFTAGYLRTNNATAPTFEQSSLNCGQSIKELDTHLSYICDILSLSLSLSVESCNPKFNPKFNPRNLYFDFVNMKLNSVEASHCYIDNVACLRT